MQTAGQLFVSRDQLMLAILSADKEHALLYFDLFNLFMISVNFLAFWVGLIRSPCLHICGVVCGVVADDGVSGTDSIIPHILSSTSLAKSELVSRVPSKYLTTWGFSSTTFCGESVSRPCSWTVTVERNMAHLGAPLATAGYLFGIGVSGVSLGSKEVAGMTSASHALVCVGGGALCFAHDGQQDAVAPAVDALPVTVTIAVRPEMPDVMVFTYKLASVADGRRVSVVGRRIIHDSALCTAAFPIFTVSQHVKVLFPTYV